MTAAGSMPTATASRPGAKAIIRYLRMSASKVRVVLDLIRGKQVSEAIEILSFSERLAAQEVLKCLNSAVANAEHNEDIPSEQLYVSACFADQGPSLRRFRPRARGRAGRIHKQTCHVTIEVSRLTDEEMEAMVERQERKSQSSTSSATSKSSGGDRARRVAKSKAAAAAKEADEAPADEAASDDDVIDAEIVDSDSDIDTDTDSDDTAEAAADETNTEDADSEDTTDDSDDTAGDRGEEE
jgi:large subunit ribosomal protein L22